MPKFLALWGTDGLEGLVEISQYENIEKQNIFNILAEKSEETNPLGRLLIMMKLRAQANPQRYCELYAFSSDINQTDIEILFEKQPQLIVDCIRDSGIKLEDCRPHHKPKIT